MTILTDKCLVHNVKKIVKRVLDGTVSLPGKYNKGEEAVLGYREKQFEIYTNGNKRLAPSRSDV